MSKLATVLLVSAIAPVIAASIAGCAAATDPSSTPGASASAPSVPEEIERAAPHNRSTDITIVPIGPICLAPITPMTGDWSCGASGVRTGEKMATTTSGYTNNCTGRAWVDFSTPKCAVPSTNVQYDEIMVSAVGISSLSAAACAQTYLDYTIWGESAATSAWSVAESGRAYGVYQNGYCDLAAPTYYPVSADWTQFEISADAYETGYIRLLNGTVTEFQVPVNVFFDASFY
jgi:hypothetical protein